MNRKIRSFTDIVAWQVAHKLVMNVYVETKGFPKEEMFGITVQMRRAAVSVTSNIAEGFSRRNIKEKRQFFYIAQSSLSELQSQLIISKDLKYISDNRFQIIASQAVRTSKLINGLIKGSPKLSTPDS